MNYPRKLQSLIQALLTIALSGAGVFWYIIVTGITPIFVFSIWFDGFSAQSFYFYTLPLWIAGLSIGLVASFPLIFILSRKSHKLRFTWTLVALFNPVFALGTLFVLWSSYHILILVIVICVLMTVPYFVLLRRLSIKPLVLKEISVCLFTLLVAMSGLISLLAAGELLYIGITPLPKPPDVTSNRYALSISGTMNGTTYSFGWDEDVPFEEKIARMRVTAQLYDDFAQKKGWKPISCREKLERAFELWDQEQRQSETKGLSSIFAVSCSFNSDFVNPVLRMELSENRGVVRL